MKTFEKIIPIVKKNWLRIISGLFMIVVVDILQLLVPRIMQQAIDKIDVPGFAQSGLLKYSLLIFLIAVGIAVIRFIWRFLLIGNAWIADRDIRQLFYDHLLSLSKILF